MFVYKKIITNKNHHKINNIPTKSKLNISKIKYQIDSYKYRIFTKRESAELIENQLKKLE